MENTTKPLDSTIKKPKYSKEFKSKAGLFLAAVSGAAAIVGFSTTIAAARKQDPKYFGKGLEVTRGLPETGASLALRALGWGTVYAFTGCGVLFFAIWKISGAQDLDDFRIKMGEILPRIPKNDPPQGRTEFSGLNDLLNYLQEPQETRDKK